MKIVGMSYETRGGCKNFVNLTFQKITNIRYSPSLIPRLEVVSGREFFRLYTGALLPCEMYNPKIDTVCVEIFYEDGHIEKPYAWGRVDLCDLYDVLTKNLLCTAEDSDSTKSEERNETEVSSDSKDSDGQENSETV